MSGANLFHADEQTDWFDEADIRLSQLCLKAPKYVRKFTRTEQSAGQ